MKKFFLFLSCTYLLMQCTPKTKTTEKQQFSFKGDAIGIDLTPELARINLRLTIGLIRDGFFITKKDGKITIKQLSPTELSLAEQNNIQIQQIGKWYLATLPFQTTLSFSTSQEKRFEIERWIVASRIKASPIMMILHEALSTNLASFSSYTAKGYIQNLTYETTSKDIKIKLKVVLVPHAEQ